MIKNLYNKPAVLQFAIMLLVIVGSVITALCFNEIIPKNDGIGWDGRTYANMAEDFFGFMQIVNDNSVRRFLPSFLIFCSGKLFHIPLDDRTVIKFFYVYNSLLLLLSVYTWNKIVKLFSLNIYANWIGFFALFISFSTSKMGFYYPCLMDTTGFALSLLMLRFFKENNKNGLILVSVLASMSWPALSYACLPLLFFKSSETVSNTTLPYGKYFAWLGALSFSALSTYIIYTYPDFKGFCSAPATYIINNFAPLSIICTFLFLLAFLIHLFSKVDFFNRKNISAVDIKYAIIGVGLFVFTEVAYKLYAWHFNLRQMGAMKVYLMDILVTGSRQPLCFVTDHIINFGPVFILPIIFWKRIAEFIKTQNWGVFFVFVQIAILTLDAETRHSLGYKAVIILFTLIAIQPLLNKRNTIILCALSFLFSRLWISLKSFPTNDWIANDAVNCGKFYTDTVYISVLCIVVATTILIYALFKPKRQAV